jgi:enoyl-CoA hydratase/carnithine racemase
MSSQNVLTYLENHIFHIQLNRAEKLNAANTEMLTLLAEAFTTAEENSDVRVVVVSAVGPHFTAGLDIGDVLGSAQDSGIHLIPKGSIDPWAMSTPRITKPVIVAANGTCFTLGVELILATDIAICDETAVFGQLEVTRGIIPFGGGAYGTAKGFGKALAGEVVRNFASPSSYNMSNEKYADNIQNISTVDDKGNKTETTVVDKKSRDVVNRILGTQEKQTRNKLSVLETHMNNLKEKLEGNKVTGQEKEKLDNYSQSIQN